MKLPSYKNTKLHDDKMYNKKYTKRAQKQERFYIFYTDLYILLTGLTLSIFFNTDSLIKYLFVLGGFGGFSIVILYTYIRVSQIINAKGGIRTFVEINQQIYSLLSLTT